MRRHFGDGIRNEEAETRTRKKEKWGEKTRIKRTLENREWRVKNVTEKTENKSQWRQRKRVRS